MADDDLYDHVRTGDAGQSDPRSKLNKRRPGDPGVRLEQLMRFFDTKLAKRLDDSDKASQSTIINTDHEGGLLSCIQIFVRTACVRRSFTRIGTFGLPFFSTLR